MPPSPESVIEFRNVNKRFGPTTAVDNVTFTVAAGETISLLGRAAAARRPRCA